MTSIDCILPLRAHTHSTFSLTILFVALCSPEFACPYIGLVQGQQTKDGPATLILMEQATAIYSVGSDGYLCGG
jgi:hypothetical protein